MGRHAHVRIFAIISEICKDQRETEPKIENIVQGEQKLPQKRQNAGKHNEQRIQNVFTNRKSLSNFDFLQGITHNVLL